MTGSNLEMVRRCHASAGGFRCFGDLIDFHCGTFGMPFQLVKNKKAFHGKNQSWVIMLRHFLYHESMEHCKKKRLTIRWAQSKRLMLIGRSTPREIDPVELVDEWLLRVVVRISGDY